MFEDWPKGPGIYAITCAATGKRYVGMSRSLRQRVKDHFLTLSRGKHHAKQMQADFRKHGVFSFSAEVLELCDSRRMRDLREAEHRWTTEIKPEYGGSQYSPFEALQKRQREAVKAMLILLRKLERRLGKEPELLEGRIDKLTALERVESKRQWVSSLPDDFVLDYPNDDHSVRGIYDWMESEWKKTTKPVFRYVHDYFQEVLI